jgi:hypothetical protein
MIAYNFIKTGLLFVFMSTLLIAQHQQTKTKAAHPTCPPITMLIIFYC